jgi:hypothetical protein
MVAIVIFWPGLVTAFLDKASTVDPSKIQIQIPATDYERKESEEGRSAREGDDLGDLFRRPK